MILATDVETNSLIIHKTKTFPKHIWVATTIDVDSGETRSFSAELDVCVNYGLEPIDEYWRLLDKAEFVVGHNFIKYDRPVIAKHTGYLVPLAKIEDTIVYSRLLDPKRLGGHSLAELGKLFGIEKPEHSDWTKFSPEMLHRNIEDCRITVQLYKHLKSEFKRLNFSLISYKVERNFASLMYEQEEYGFPLRTKFAYEKYYEIKDKADSLELDLVKQFEPVEDVRVGTWTHYIPRYTKSGELHKTCKRTLERFKWPEDQPETIYKPLRAFDPNSTQDRVARLLQLGWEPTAFTEKGQPRITDDSLERFNNPIGKSLKTYILLRNRENIFHNWLDKVDEDGFVHSDINQLGTWTHRCSHTNFFGNPPRVETKGFKKIELFDEHDKTDLDPEYTRDKVLETIKSSGECEIPVRGLVGNYGTECRETWGVEPDSGIEQIGVDLTGIQMRGFCHYIDDPEYTKQTISSDIHNYNRELAGLKTRASAKTFIYAFLLGSGDHKTGIIYDMSSEELVDYEHDVMLQSNYGLREKLKYGLEAIGAPLTPRNFAVAMKGREVKDKFIESIPGLQRIRKEAKIGWVECLDGRRIHVKSKHLYLACLLQSFEACVAKRVNVDYHRRLTSEGIWFKQGNMIHDEFQIFCHRGDGDYIGKTVVETIEHVGEIYKSKCPLTGNWKTGTNWKITH